MHFTAMTYLRGLVHRMKVDNATQIRLRLPKHFVIRIWSILLFTTAISPKESEGLHHSRGLSAVRCRDIVHGEESATITVTDEVLQFPLPLGIPQVRQAIEDFNAQSFLRDSKVIAFIDITFG